jgi:hypothetical protein
MSRPDEWLQNSARSALSALLARLDLDRGGRPFFWVNYDPPEARHSYWDCTDIAGRYVDGLVLARAMTGSSEGTEAEALLRTLLWAQQDPEDGLFYNTDESAVDPEMDKYRPEGRVPTAARHVDLFCQRGPLLALTTMMAGGDGPAASRARRLVSGLGNLGRRAGDETSFDFIRWAPVMKSEWSAPEGPPFSWLGYRYAWLTGLARYVEITRDPHAADLAMSLSRFYMRHGDVPADGRFRGNTHSGGILPTLVGIARLGLWAGDREMVAWVQRAFEWVRAESPDFGFVTDGLGLDGFFAHTCETCGLADMVHLAVLLSDAGVGDYWDDVERYARNQLLENQYRDRAAIAQALPGISERVLAMLVGGFECTAYPNSILTWNGAEGCCIGGGLRALYLVWRAGVRETTEETRVTMGFSRSTPCVDIVGHEPWAGLREVRVRSPRRVLIRAPEGVSPEKATTMVDGRLVDVRWQGRYARFDSLRSGQVAALAYPLQTSRRAYQISGKTFEADWIGSTIVEVNPVGERHRIYQRRELVAGSDPAQGVLAQLGTPEGDPSSSLW